MAWLGAWLGLIRLVRVQGNAEILLVSTNSLIVSLVPGAFNSKIFASSGVRRSEDGETLQLLASRP